MMPKTTMTSLFSFSKPSPSSPSSSSIQHSSPSTPPHTLSLSMAEENIDNAESMIMKWDPNSSSYVKFLNLFQDDRKEAKEFIKCIKDLRRAMHFLVSKNLGSNKLVLAQKLMQMAMKRLEKEFYHILLANKEYLDPNSISSRSSGMSPVALSCSDDEDNVGLDNKDRTAGESISNVERLSVMAMSDLKLIADCMINSGYGAECVKIYNIIRKSIVEEALYRLGIEPYSSSQISKMNSEALEHNIKNWLNAINIAMKTLFHSERFLSDHVFSASDTIRESCFTKISKEGAINLFKFPEFMTKSKKSPENIFRLMDLYETISDLWPEIESIFSYESVSAIKLQALSSLHKLSNTVQTILSEFESSIQKNSLRTPISGGGIHPLTNSVMIYIAILTNYSGVLTNIIGDSPSLSPSPGHSPFPESYFDSPMSAVSARLAWIILILLCKLDNKAELYNDIALSYLFLANNLQFIVEKVRTTNLKYLLGEDWVSKHERKVKQYTANYETLAWNKVFTSLPENSTAASMSIEMVKGCFKQFNSAFEESYWKQRSWVVSDGKLRDEIKVSIAKKIVPVYREFCDAGLVTLSGEKNLEVVVRFTPDDLGNYLSDLFNGSAVSGSSSSSSSHSSSAWASRCFP